MLKVSRSCSGVSLAALTLKTEPCRPLLPGQEADLKVLEATSKPSPWNYGVFVLQTYSVRSR